MHVDQPRNPGERAQIRATITDSLANGYGVRCSRGTTVVLRRGTSGGALSPEVASFLRESA